MADPLAAQTIPALVQAGAHTWPDAEAVVDGEVRLTYVELAARVDAFAAALLARGHQPGDRVAVWAPNGWRWIVAALGTLTAGGVLVPLNTRYKGSEAGYILRRTGAKLLVTQDGFLGNHYVAMLAGEDLPALSTVVSTEPVPATPGGRGALGWDEFVAGGAAVPVEVVRRRAESVTGDDLADIFFTSGTTGLPKGAMATHAPALRIYTSWSELAGLRAGDRYLIVNPFFHTFGYKAGVLACLLRGATIVPMPVFDVEATLATIARERITVVPGAPTLYISILDHPKRSEYDLSSWRVAVTGAATVPVVMIERLQSELALRTVLTAYGMTECNGTATMCLPGDDAQTVANTCGRAIPDTEVRVAGPDGSTLPPGEPGEVLVRGFGVMRGYLDDEESTRQAIDADGWLHTGDIGVMDERGYLKITDRLKDMFIVGGFNVYPAEVEQALARHPAVAESAVIGVPDERLGEVGRAFVVLKPGARCSDDDLLSYARERLANFKVPRSVVFVDSLPRNAGGKVTKNVLRER
jgi:acyl-CoA synthetase (AMP-forming)/AMP-acid ligase II